DVVLTVAAASAHSPLRSGQRNGVGTTSQRSGGDVVAGALWRAFRGVLRRDAWQAGYRGSCERTRITPPLRPSPGYGQEGSGTGALRRRAGKATGGEQAMSAGAMVSAPRASALAGMLWPARYGGLSGVSCGGMPGRRATAVRASAHASPHRYGPRPGTGRKDQELGRCAVVRGRPLVVNR